MNLPGDTAALHPGHHAYALASRFFQELVARGIELVIASPGSRSTALITAAATTPGLSLDIQHDERVAAFVALGYGKAARKPAALVCTSGSAGAHYLPAVLEGHYSGVPMIILTADRPAELQGVGAPQTVDQSRFFAGSTRLTRLLSDIESLSDGDVVGLAGDVWDAASERQGPVHVNWQFPEPLEPGPLGQLQRSHELSSSERHPDQHVQPHRPASPLESGQQASLRELLSAHRGMIVVGPDDHSADVRDRILAFATDRGWPVFADIGSGLRTADPPSAVIPWIEPAFEHGGFADHHVPGAVLRIGRMPTTKAFSQWLERHREVPVVLLNSHIETHDFTATASMTLQGNPVDALEGAGPADGRDPDWLDLWEAASHRASLAAWSDLPPGSETRQIVSAIRGLDHGSSVHLASSMPIRHADGFAGNLEQDIRVFVNRGTNGIDGTISTTLGESMALQQPSIVVLGDIAFLHDVGGLLAAGRSDRNLTLVVIDNGGGGIFSFLPIADQLAAESFDRLFRTPHKTDIEGLAISAGARVHTDPEAISAATRTPGLDVVVLETDPDPAPPFRSARTAATAAMLAEDRSESDA